MAKYAFSTAALYPLDSEISLKLIGKAGFKYAELMPQCFSDVTDEFALRAINTGVHVGSIHYPLAMFPMLYTAHPGMSADGRKFASDLVNLGLKLGTEVLVIHPHVPPDPVYSDVLEKPIIENIIYLADLCAEKGITLAMENSQKGPGRTAEELLNYIRSLGNHPGIKPMVDTTEACEAFQDPGEFIRAVKPVHLHLSDHKEEVKHLPAGKGDINWEDIRDSLCGYDGYYTLEPSYKFYIENPEKKLTEAYEFIGNLIKDK